MSKKKRDIDERMPEDEALECIMGEIVELSDCASAEFAEGMEGPCLIVTDIHGDSTYLTLREAYTLFEWLRTHESELLSLVEA